jgi:hypothetical protein
MRQPVKSSYAPLFRVTDALRLGLTGIRVKYSQKDQDSSIGDQAPLSFVGQRG